MIFCAKTFIAELFYSSMPVIFSFQKGKSKFRKHYNENRDYYQYYNLANQGYKQLKGYTQETIRSGEYTSIDGVFAPFNIPIGCSVGTAIKKLGRPLHIVTNCKVMKYYRTFYFKRKIGDLKCQIQLHFHRGRLFMSQIDIQQKTGMSQDHKKVIKSLLGDHIDMNCKEGGSITDFMHFEDKEGNSISASCDHFSVQMIFANPNHSSLTELLAVKFKEYSERRKSSSDYHHLIVKKASN
jgi:hypothetical protein